MKKIKFDESQYKKGLGKASQTYFSIENMMTQHKGCRHIDFLQKCINMLENNEKFTDKFIENYNNEFGNPYVMKGLNTIQEIQDEGYAVKPDEPIDIFKRTINDFYNNGVCNEIIKVRILGRSIMEELDKEFIHNELTRLLSEHGYQLIKFSYDTDDFELGMKTIIDPRVSRIEQIPLSDKWDATQRNTVVELYWYIVTSGWSEDKSDELKLFNPEIDLFREAPMIHGVLKDNIVELLCSVRTTHDF